MGFNKYQKHVLIKISQDKIITQRPNILSVLVNDFNGKNVFDKILLGQ